MDIASPLFFKFERGGRQRERAAWGEFQMVTRRPASAEAPIRTIGFSEETNLSSANPRASPEGFWKTRGLLLRQLRTSTLRFFPSAAPRRTVDGLRRIPEQRKTRLRPTSQPS